MGDGRISLRPRATIPLKKSYRMSLLSAGSISLDSTFNDIFLPTLEQVLNCHYLRD